RSAGAGRRRRHRAGGRQLRGFPARRRAVLHSRHIALPAARHGRRHRSGAAVAAGGILRPPGATAGPCELPLLTSPLPGRASPALGPFVLAAFIPEASPPPSAKRHLNAEETIPRD